MRLIFIASAALLLLLSMGGPTAAATLIWDASSGSVDGYLVEISTDEGLTWGHNYTVPGDTTELPLDDKLQYNTSYGFRVSAFNAAGISAPCAPIYWTRPPYAPPAVVPLPPVTGGVQPSEPTGPEVSQ